MSQLPTPSHHFRREPSYASSSLMRMPRSRILTAPLRFSIFKGGLFEPGLDALLGNPHTPSSLDTDRYKALEPTFYIFFIAMALLLQLLRWQQRHWEKAFKIGYYRHQGAVGLLDLGASESFVIKRIRLETGCKDLCSLLSTHPYSS